MEQQGPWGERRETRQAFEEEGAAAMPKVCQLLLTLAPMAQTAPGQGLATLVLCQRRREAEQQVCVEPEKFYWPSNFYIFHFFADGSVLEWGNENFVLYCVSAYICPFFDNIVTNKWGKRVEIFKIKKNIWHCTFTETGRTACWIHWGKYNMNLLRIEW